MPYGGPMPLYEVEILQSGAAGDGARRLVRRYHSDSTALAGEFDKIDEADLVAVAGTLKPAVPENHASASVQGAEETLFDPAGMPSSDQIAELQYSLSLAQPMGETVAFAIRDMR